jgi:uncharacterized protein (TIGR03086 family)
MRTSRANVKLSKAHHNAGETSRGHAFFHCDIDCHAHCAGNDQSNINERHAMEPSEQLAIILPTLTALVDQLEPTDLDNPTPCSNFTVHGVLDHMIGGATNFVPAFQGVSPTEPAAPPVTAGKVPTAEFGQAMSSLLDAVNSPGAMQRTISAPFGDVPGSVFARFVAFDGLIHGYDLASSTGLVYDPPADVVAAVDSFAREALGPDMRDGDTFALETAAPDGASVLHKLVAFSGRVL